MKREVATTGALVLLFFSQAMPMNNSGARAAEIESAGTVPFIFDDNRVFAELTFVRPDGTLRKAFAFVDLGTPGMVLDKEAGRRASVWPRQTSALPR